MGFFDFKLATQSPPGVLWNLQISDTSELLTIARTASKAILCPSSQMRPTDIRGLVTAAIWNTLWTFFPSSLRLKLFCPTLGIVPRLP